MTACIVGWAHTPFGKLAGESVESLIVRVANEALTDAGIARVPAVSAARNVRAAHLTLGDTIFGPALDDGFPDKDINRANRAAADSPVYTQRGAERKALAMPGPPTMLDARYRRCRGKRPKFGTAMNG